jgi:hypothetical protein
MDTPMYIELHICQVLTKLKQKQTPISSRAEPYNFLATAL